MHGADVAFRPNGGRYCLDGLVFADRTPSPGLAELKKAIEPLAIDVTPDGITVLNKYNTLSLDHLAFSWVAELDGVPIDSGSLTLNEGPNPVPTVAAGNGETWLTVTAALATVTPWADA